MCVCMCVCVLRGDGIQLLHRADEEDEPELPSRWRHGLTLCQYALAHPGEIYENKLICCFVFASVCVS